MKNRIREFRAKLNLSQTELSKKSGVSRVTISFLESEKTCNTTSNTLLKIAKALNATVNEIFFS